MLDEKLKSWIVTLDVLKSIHEKDTCGKNRLNSNIRCIEMIITKLESVGSIRWIVTLDVLKFCSMLPLSFPVALNSNIRCIEIQYC